MRFDQFIHRIEELAGDVSREKAVQAARATLATLGERMGRSETEHLAAQLPGEMKGFLFIHETSPQYRDDHAVFGLEEFYNKVSARADVGYRDAVKLARAVVKVLQEAVSPGEIEDVLSTLPEDYRELFGRKPSGPASPSST